MVKTEKAQQKPFAVEPLTNRRYLSFAQAAGSVGLVQVARVFREAAQARTMQAQAHLMCARG